MSLEVAGVRRTAVLGTVTGARTFMAPAALALRGRFVKAARFVVPVLAAGEIVADKLPVAPPRVQGPGLVGRVVSGAVSGRVSGGSRGARVGAAFALAATYPSQALRSQIVQHTALPDLACAFPEDLVAASAAAAASTEPRPDVGGPKTQGEPEFATDQHGVLAAAGVGLVAAAVGTAAMTSAQKWIYGLTGGDESEAPRVVGEKILGHFGVKARKEQRPALNTAMHVLYGTSWGLPFGLAFGRGRPPGPGKGATFGLNVWLASLVALPAFGVAPPPWRQSPAALVQDLGFHLVYGTATAAAGEAFSA
jgi:uncharacterized membrane protein